MEVIAERKHKSTVILKRIFEVLKISVAIFRYYNYFQTAQLSKNWWESVKIAYILSLAHFEAKPQFYIILTNSVTRGRELPMYVLDCRCFRECSVLSLKAVKCFTEKYIFQQASFNKTNIERYILFPEYVYRTRHLVWLMYQWTLLVL